MLTSRRRPDAPPPPKPTSTTDPLAQTNTEWREAEREKAAQRKRWVLRAALVLTLPFLAGALYASSLPYVWRVACVRVPVLRRWGVLFAVPAAVACYLFPGPVLGPTRDLLLLPVTAAPGLPIAGTIPLPLPLDTGALEVVYANPFPLLREHLTLGWAPGLVCAALVCASWGVGGFLEGRRLHSRTPDEVIGNYDKAVKRSGGSLDVLEGVLLRGFITLLYGASGVGKTELALGMIATALRGDEFCGRKTRPARFYYVVEQADENFAPYLKDWRLTNAVTHGRLRIVTRSEANALWKAHGHDVEPGWPELAPLLFRDAADWGADCVVVDTWTDWSGAIDNPTIKKHLAIGRTAVATYGYALWAIGHMKDGRLYGGQVFHKLCEVTLKMEAPLGNGNPVRVLSFDKDRTRRGQLPFAVERDIDGDPPGYVAVPLPENEGQKLLPDSQHQKADLREVEPEWMRVKALLPATAAELVLQTAWPPRTTYSRLRQWEKQGRVIYVKTEKGRAIPGTWTLTEGNDDKAPAAAS